MADKKKIAILLHGEIRNSSLGRGTKTGFVDTFKNCFLNNKITDNYEVNIFFVTDKAIPEKIYNYFDTYLKGFLQLDKEDIREPLNVKEYIDKYMTYYEYRRENPDKFPYSTPSREIQVYSMYKRYCGWYLMQEYENKINIKHDYIFSTRHEYYFTHDIWNYIQDLENGKYFLNQNDYAYFGRYDIMCHYSKVIFNYGKYMYNEIIHPDEIIDNLSKSPYKYRFLAKNIWPCWLESPEVQVFEHILQYYYANNLTPSQLGYMGYPNALVEYYTDRKEYVDWS